MQQCKLCETVSLLTNASLKRAQKHVAEGRLFISRHHGIRTELVTAAEQSGRAMYTNTRPESQTRGPRDICTYHFNLHEAFTEFILIIEFDKIHREEF